MLLPSSGLKEQAKQETDVKQVASRRTFVCFVMKQIDNHLSPLATLLNNM
jgi:hypothetical protein